MDSDTQVIAYAKLKHAIATPSIEDLYIAGYECALESVSEADNPYSPNSIEYQHWADGWAAGFYGEEPLFTPESNVVAQHAEQAVELQAQVPGIVASLQALASRAKQWADAHIQGLGYALVASTLCYLVVDMVLMAEV